MLLNEIVPSETASRYRGDVKLDEKTREAVEDLKAVNRLHDRHDMRVPNLTRKIFETIHPVRIAAVHEYGGLPTPLKIGIDWFTTDYFKRRVESVNPSHVKADDRDGLGYAFTETDPVGCLAKSPLASLDDLRRIATDFCLAIMPVAALADCAPGGSESRMIARFCHAAGLYNDVYALAPLRLHSLEKHVKYSKAPLVLYAPNAQQTADALLMNIPMFRSVIGDIKGLEGRVKELERGTASLAARVEQVEKQMKDTRALVARAEATAEAAVRRARALEEKVRIVVEDPLLFAVRSGCNIEVESGFAFLGPCWGQDIPPEVVERLGYEKLTTRAAYDKHLHWN